MYVDRSMDLHEAAEILSDLAALVEENDLSAADIGQFLSDASHNWPTEPSASARSDMEELRQSDTDSKRFAAGLRRQAEALRRRAESSRLQAVTTR